MRLVFDAPPGPAVNATLVDMGDRFRMVLNEVEVVSPPEPLTKLPVARALWKPLPDLNAAAAAWIYAGGSHHPTSARRSRPSILKTWHDAGVELLSSTVKPAPRLSATSNGPIPVSFDNH